MVTKAKDGTKVGWHYYDKNYRKGRHNREYVNSLKATPSKEDWQRLAAGCIAAIVEQGDQAEANVVVSFSYLMKFPKGFPFKVFLGVDGRNNIYQIKAVKLYDWLLKNGYATISLLDVERYRLQMTKMLKEMDKKFGLGDEAQIGDLDV